jgi:cardiolipin synthase C
MSLFVLPLLAISCLAPAPTPTVSPQPEASRQSLSASLGTAGPSSALETGMYLLENGGQSLVARLWLFEHAKKSIDIQYYSLAKDITGRITCDYLIRAANRGVKIRLLVDDAANKMKNKDVKLLDSHENIEIRVYNAGLKSGKLAKRLHWLKKNHNRLLRRMHNKNIAIDGEACILGGRNIADRYFDYSRKYNFRDRDVLLFGKSAREARRSFEEFWNDTLTVPYELLNPGKKKKAEDARRFDCLQQHEGETLHYFGILKEKVNQYPGRFKQASEAGELVWSSDAAFLSDKPGKNENREARKGGASTDTLVKLIRSAKSTIDIHSPYFITTEEGTKLIAETVKRGVKVRLLTNSLASTDNDEAFSGYHRQRKELLKTGVEIYEFKPDAAVRYKLMEPEVQQEINYKPVYGFHSKSIIIDKTICVVGSYNFDPRSANYNTECILIARSAELVRLLQKQIDEEFKPENAWPISETCNPDSEAGLRKRLKIFTRRIIPRKVL